MTPSGRMTPQVDSNEHDDSFSPPTAQDGFDRPSEDVRRRNMITAAIISGIVLVWVLYGLRGVLF